MSAAIRASKKKLRQSMAQLLGAIPQEALIAQSDNIAKMLSSLPVVQQSRKVGVYMSMDTAEVKTLGLIKTLFDMGKKVYLPHCAALQPSDLRRFDKQNACLIFYQMPTYQSVLDLKPVGKYQLKEPTSGQNIMDEEDGLDLLLLPAVAYTRDCYRLGHGVGFYDDYIKRHNERFGKKPFLLGTGLREQLVNELPLEQHDEKLDTLILDEKVYYPDE